MTNLVLRDSFFKDLFDFRRDFDEIFSRILTGKPFGQEIVPFETAFNFAPPVESYVDKDGKKYICRVSLPGVEPKDVEIHTQGNLLTIKGERKVTRKVKEVDLMHEEIAYGMFERTLTLPEGVLTDKLVAEFHNGLLEISAPVSVAALPRKIEIKTVPISKQIAA
jgi:HSP20 family protein